MDEHWAGPITGVGDHLCDVVVFHADADAEEGAALIQVFVRWKEAVARLDKLASYPAILVHRCVTYIAVVTWAAHPVVELNHCVTNPLHQQEIIACAIPVEPVPLDRVIRFIHPGNTLLPVGGIHIAGDRQHGHRQDCQKEKKLVFHILMFQKSCKDTHYSRHRRS